MTAREFIDLVWERNTPGYITLLHRDPDPDIGFSVYRSYSLLDRSQLVEDADGLRDRDVWISCGLQDIPSARGKSRGKAKQITAIPGVWADIDVNDGEGTHSSSRIAPSYDVARQILEGLEFTPNIVVDSGHGLQAWWLFDQPWVFETEQDWEQAWILSRRMHQYVAAEANLYGVQIDNVSDLSRVLRLPGTFNHKTDPVPVQILEYSLDRYAVVDLANRLPELAAGASGASEGGNQSAYQTFDAKLAAIEDNCGWMGYCRDNPADLTEPEWYFQLTVLTKTDGWEDTVQLRSEGHPGYDPEETRRKAARAHSKGPVRCPTVAEKFGSSHCDNCAFKGLIESPITLSRKDPDAILQAAGKGTTDDPENHVPGLQWGQPTMNKQMVDARETDPYVLEPLFFDAIVHRQANIRVFRMADSMVRITPTGTIQKLDDKMAVRALHQACHFYRVSKNGELTDAPCPDLHRKFFMGATTERLNEIQQVVRAPVFSPSGEIEVEPGYHAKSKTWYIPDPDLTIPPVPAEPSDEWVEGAKRIFFDDLLVDFPFLDQSSKAHALALILLPFVRNMINGPTPLHLIAKPEPGTGASLIADVISTISLGEPAPTKTAPTNQDEWQKALLTYLLDAHAYVIFDNINDIDSPALAAALTSSKFSGRVLGGSTSATIETKCVWIATGNNPPPSEEIARRTVMVYLKAPPGVAPWARTGFKHENLRKWTVENRDKLIAAAHTLVQNWIAKGKPGHKGSEKLGSYEAYVDVIGGILSAANVPGFLENMNNVREIVAHKQDSRFHFLVSWWNGPGQTGTPVKASDLLDIARDAGYVAPYENPQHLGNALRTEANRPIHGIHPAGLALFIVYNSTKRAWLLVPEDEV